ncbi:hypothetical protein [Streptococcus dysgalactiae]|uniref:hypothetical protein n=1 Tax=Streptococcus dysgalactiae TaxID=1334 RepID=UPI00159ED2E1|nr:hypothetical protein [Streptococcus dysgalactiae]
MIIEQVLFLLPDSYFYTPEIKEGVFKRLRDEMKEVRRKQTFPAYFGDKSLKQKHLKLVIEYEKQLTYLANSKRELLKEELLLESEGMKCACLISLISQYRLLERLRTYS